MLPWTTVEEDKRRRECKEKFFKKKKRERERERETETETETEKERKTGKFSSLPISDGFASFQHHHILF